MESAEEFAVEYLDALDRDEQPQLAKRIQARDAAVALALLAELKAWVVANEARIPPLARRVAHPVAGCGKKSVVKGESVCCSKPPGHEPEWHTDRNYCWPYFEESPVSVSLAGESALRGAGERFFAQGTETRLQDKLTESEAAVARLREELEALRKLEDVALERGRTPSLSNQVRLDEMCRHMALAARKLGICEGCDTRLADCGPALWATQRKCCPDCTHVSDPPPVSDSAEGVEPTSTRSDSR